MEFACKVAGAKIIVVLGHTKCGAIKGACDHVEMGNLTNLFSENQDRFGAHAIYQWNGLCLSKRCGSQQCAPRDGRNRIT
jgi:hypothetical protein